MKQLLPQCWCFIASSHTDGAAWSFNRSQTCGLTISLVYEAISSSHLGFRVAKALSRCPSGFSWRSQRGLCSLPKPSVCHFSRSLPNLFLRSTGTLPGQFWYFPHDDLAKLTRTFAVHLQDGTGRVYEGFCRETAADSWEILWVISVLEGLAWATWRATSRGKAQIYKQIF